VKKPYRIVFMGSPDFAVPILEALSTQNHIVGVVTQPDRPAGRGSTPHQPAVKTAALRLGVPVIQPEKLRQPEAVQQLQAWTPDVIVVAAFGQILRLEVLNFPRFGCINVHGSLLPRWRGAAPIQAAILAGDTETGISIIKMDLGIDTGPLLSQRPIAIAPQETSESLTGKLAALGTNLLSETLPAFLRGEIVPKPQGEDRATYAPLLRKEDGVLDFGQPAIVLERRIRAFLPWPGTYFDWNGAPLKVLAASVSTSRSPGEGIRIKLNGLPAVGTGDGILLLEEVQPAGRKPMPGKAFLAGARDWIS
jgi:methionyl-tRNA formyltransferase